MDVNVQKTKYTLFGISELHPVGLKPNGITVEMERTPRLLGVAFQNHRGMSTHVAQTWKAIDFRLRQLASIFFSAWGPKRDTPRVFHLALVQTKAIYGVDVCCWHVAKTTRDKPAAARQKASRIVACIPKWGRRENTSPEANLLLLETSLLT